MCIHYISSLAAEELPSPTHTSPANPSKLALSHYDKNMTAPSSPTFSSRPSWSVVSFAYGCGRWRHGNPKKGRALTNPPPPFCAVKLSRPPFLFFRWKSSDLIYLYYEYATIQTAVIE